MPGNVTYQQDGNASFPSPSIWADCPFEELKNGDRPGWAFYYQPFGATADTIASGEQRPNYGPFTMLCDNDVVTSMKGSEQGGYLTMTTPATDNQAALLHTEPLAKLVSNSGKRIWLEGRIEVTDVDGDQGVLFGLGEEACQSADVIDDNAAALMDETFLGFVQLESEATLSLADDAIHCIAQKDAAATIVALLEDVTDADALGDDGAAEANLTEYKLGLYFDGKTTVKVFVNGVECAAWTVSTTYTDATKALCVLLGFKTGAATANSISVNWVKYASEA